MASKVVLLALLGVACAASVEKRQGAHVAQAKDGASHGSSHGHFGGSSYAALPPSTYDEGGSQGNFYYYDYPASDYGLTDFSDGGFDLFAALFMPIIVIGGCLIILTTLTFSLSNGRALSTDPKESSIMDEMYDEIERVFYIYLNAFESEQCIQRTICQLGTYAKDFKGKNFVLSLVETLAPEEMKNNVAIFAKAAESGYDTDSEDGSIDQLAIHLGGIFAAAVEGGDECMQRAACEIGVASSTSLHPRHRKLFERLVTSVAPAKYTTLLNKFKAGATTKHCDKSACNNINFDPDQ